MSFPKVKMVGWYLLLVAGTFALAAYAEAKDEGNEPAVPADLQQKIDSLITQLGSDRYAARESATAELQKVGKPAIAALQAALESKDPEVRARSQKLLYAILPETMPRESIVIESVNAADGVLILQGPYREILITSVNGEGVVESEAIDAEELWLGTINGEAKVTLKGNAKTFRIGDINGEPVIDASGLNAETIEIGGMNGSPTIMLRSTGTVTFTGNVLGSSKVTVAAKGDVTLKESIHGGVRLHVVASRDFAIEGEVGGGVTIVAAYSGEAKYDGPPRANIQLSKVAPPE